MLFAGGEKAVECQGIFADMRVDEKSDFGVEFTEGGKGGKRNGDEIANTGDIENDLIGTFFEQAAAEESDHRMKYCCVGRKCQREGRYTWRDRRGSLS